MNSFTAKLQTGKVDIGVIVTPIESDRKFKIEMVTGDPNPVTLTRGEKGVWLIDNPGKWAIADKDFQKLGKIIDEQAIRNKK